MAANIASRVGSTTTFGPSACQASRRSWHKESGVATVAGASYASLFPTPLEGAVVPPQPSNSGKEIELAAEVQPAPTVKSLSTQFGPLTGGSLNPARALGPAIVAGHFAGGFGRFLLVYILAPLIGGLLASIGYKLLVLDPQHRLGERPIDKLA